MDIDEAREIIERLGNELPQELTRGETSELNRARFAIERHERAEAKRRKREDDSARVAEAMSTSRVRAEDGAPLAHAELEAEARALYQKGLARLRLMLEDPHATNVDVNTATAQLRLAASIGQSEPAPTVYRLPMASLLGADGPRQDSTGPEVPDSPPLSHETRQRDDDE